MNYLQSIILGVVEGLTEFLPISSTFHLILTSRLLGLVENDFLKMFEVVIQVGAVFALVFLYARTLLSNRRLLGLLLASFLPTALVGKVLYHTIKSLFFANFALQVTVFVAIGILMLILENLVKNNQLVLSRDLSQMSYSTAILIGLFQSLSVIPGVSRSGSILLGMLSLGFTRKSSTTYTFLLSLPTIAAASILDLYQNQALLFSSGNNWLVIALGTCSAFVSGYFVVRWLTQYLSTHTLKPFAYYRFALALLLLKF